MAKKICSICLEPKDISEFSTDKSTRDNLSTRCRKCGAAASKAWRMENQDRARLAKKIWRNNNQEVVRENKRKWYAANKEKAKACIAKFFTKHPERKKEITQKWNDANPEKRLEIERNRRARMSGSGGTITLAEWENMKEKYGYTCLKCGLIEPEIKLTLDHVVPISLGGSNTIENAQPLCFSCNSKKNASIADYR